jgi:integrase
MQDHFKRVITACGIDHATYHALRHTFATRCVELGFDVKSLSELLGHAAVGMTLDRYVHPTLEHKRINMQRLSGHMVAGITGNWHVQQNFSEV